RSLPTARLRHMTQLESFQQRGDLVDAQLVDTQSGERETVQASYLVGCDGFDGIVRKELGIEYTGFGVLSYSVSIFFRSPGLIGLHDKGWSRFYRLVDGSGHWG